MVFVSPRVSAQVRVPTSAHMRRIGKIGFGFLNVGFLLLVFAGSPPLFIGAMCLGSSSTGFAFPAMQMCRKSAPQ